MRWIQRRAFTLIELLVAIGMIAILMAIFIPYLVRLRESANRTACAANLQQIGRALNQYASDNGSHFMFPQVRYDAASSPDSYTAYTGADAGNPFAPDSAVKPCDVTASLWLLLRGDYIKDPAAFICPSTNDEPDSITDNLGHKTKVTSRGNFRKRYHLSYSYASPFTSAYDWHFSSDLLPSQFVVVADKNPGFATGAGGVVIGPARNAPPFELARGNSANHGRAGQNVLHPAGDVSFEPTPYCGVSHDNIYTAVSRTPLQDTHPQLDAPGYLGRDIGAGYNYDSYLVPTDEEGPQ